MFNSTGKLALFRDLLCFSPKWAVEELQQNYFLDGLQLGSGTVATWLPPTYFTPKEVKQTNKTKLIFTHDHIR